MDEQQASDLEQASNLGQASDLEIDAPEADAAEADAAEANAAEANAFDVAGSDMAGPDMAEPNTGRRFFNRAEHFVLQAAAGGRCEECGAALSDDFHADHRHPFIAGGPTDLSNAQALCPNCNRRKAARLSQDAARLAAQRTCRPPQGTRRPPPASRPPLPSWSLSLRPWQQRGTEVWEQLRTQQTLHALHEANASGPDVTGTDMTGTDMTGTDMTGTDMTGTDMTGTNMTVTATPGSGKTNLALFLAVHELRQGRADILVVIVPSLAIKDQWATSAHRAGLRLTASWGNNTVALLPDVHGCLATYAQVAALPDALRLLCARHRVFCVLDEIHHAAESRAWGNALYQALEYAVARLCLSGTAWRQDGNMIPFVRYDAAGNSVSDVSYSYSEALRDGVVREAFFFALNARTVWLGEQGEVTATFDDMLSEQDESRRLRAALHAEGGWLEAAILRADAALSAARRGLPHTGGPTRSGLLQSGHPQARGLLVAMNSRHARAVAARMLALTGEMPAVALSDDPASLSVLTRFRSGGGRWLVVCRMAGEGYDCPDIRVVLWATNITGEGAFRQIVARALRVVPGLQHQDAQVFLPADRRLLALARGLVQPSGRSLRTEERNEEYENNESNESNEENGAAALDLEVEGREARGEEASLFVPLTSRAFGQRMVTNGAVVPASAMLRARTMNAGPSGFSGLPDYALAAVIARMEAEANDVGAILPAIVLPETAESQMALPEAAEVNPRASLEAGEVSETYDHESETYDHESETYDHESETYDHESETYDHESETYDHESETYDQRRQALRRLCTRLTALIARELDVNPSVVHRAFRRSLGVRQADSTLAELELRKQSLEGKLRELRAGSV